MPLIDPNQGTIESWMMSQSAKQFLSSITRWLPSFALCDVHLNMIY